jgi:hypothetical protein
MGVPGAVLYDDGWRFGYYDLGSNQFTGYDSQGRPSTSSAAQVSYISADKTCPPLTAATDPAHAVQLQGMPACIDLKKQGTLAPYGSGGCLPVPNYTMQLFA